MCDGFVAFSCPNSSPSPTGASSTGATPRFPPTKSPTLRTSPPRLVAGPSARLSAYRSRRYSADFASGDGGDVDGDPAPDDAFPRPHARHAAASYDTVARETARPTALESFAVGGRCTGLGLVVDAAHARHHAPLSFASEISTRTDEISALGDPAGTTARCDVSTRKLSFGLIPRDRAREPLPIKTSHNPRRVHPTRAALWRL